MLLVEVKCADLNPEHSLSDKYAQTPKWKLAYVTI